MNFSDVRLPWPMPPYPPYHEGYYMEEYFYNYYIKNKNIFDETGYTLIPIFWTSAYIRQIDLQPYIDCLPKDLKYFCVSQHDDSVKEKLPPGTKVFSAGGNSGGIPIPLVCSDIKNKPEREKDIFCSFVGSLTHNTRTSMFNYLKDDELFYFKVNDWSWNIEKQKEDHFIDIISRSKFTLCPRGYGAQSFRFYEALQLGSVPIYIHDDTAWRPYVDILDWESFSINLHINDINLLKEKILNISDEQLSSMVDVSKKVYRDFFSMKNLPLQILNRLKT